MAAAHLTVSQMLTWIGISTAGHRNAVKEDMMPQPEGIAHLQDETTDGIKDACNSYAKRPGNGRFVITRVQMKRMISLMHCVKDMKRLDEEIAFDAGTERDEFLEALKEASEREESRKAQRKIGEALLGKDFQTKLKNGSQWDRWSQELESVLNAMIGANGVPLAYIIRKEDAPDLSDRPTWELKAIHGAPHEGRAWKIDNTTVHQIILQNIGEDSDAYTYIKTRIRQENGRVDIKALRERFENTSTQEAKINAAKRTIETIQYRNERSMSFEKFSAKLQRALDDLEAGGRAMHNGDVVDLIWKKVLNSELKGFLDALKVDNIRAPKEYRTLLQEIATQIPNISTSSSFRGGGSPRGVSELRQVTGYTRDGECPDHGVHTGEGQLYIGNYHGNKWFEDDVKPYHDEIRTARQKQYGGNNGGGNNPKKSNFREKKKTQNLIRKNKRKVAQLQSQVAELNKVKEQKLKDTPANRVLFKDPIDDQAGTAFGGKNGKKK